MHKQIRKYKNTLKNALLLPRKGEPKKPKYQNQKNQKKQKKNPKPKNTKKQFSGTLGEASQGFLRVPENYCFLVFCFFFFFFFFCFFLFVLFIFFWFGVFGFLIARVFGF